MGQPWQNQGPDLLTTGGRYWDRTSDLFGVNGGYHSPIAPVTLTSRAA